MIWIELLKPFCRLQTWYHLHAHLLFTTLPYLYLPKASFLPNHLSLITIVNLVMQIMASLLLLSMLIFSFDTVHGLKGGWQKAHATFYGGEDASGTMGKCFCVCQLFTYDSVFIDEKKATRSGFFLIQHLNMYIPFRYIPFSFDSTTIKLEWNTPLYIFWCQNSCVLEYSTLWQCIFTLKVIYPWY